MNPSIFDVDAIASRFAERPGYRFVAYRGVAIAVYSMNLRILAVESRDIPPIHEFVIKLMAEGLTSLSVLSDILGLDQEVVRSCLVDLRRQEVIEVLSDNGSNNAQCVLTHKGKEISTNLKQAFMQEITVPNVIFHGLLRQPVDLGGFARSQYLRPIEAQDFGLDLVRAIPNRAPYPDEIDVEKLETVIKRVHHSKSGNSQTVIAVKSVLKNVRTLYEPGVMVEYETIDDQRERLISFIIGGQLKNDYEYAFIKARGPELLSNLMSPKEKSIENRIKEQVPEKVLQKLGRFDDAEDLAAKVVSVKQEVKDKQEQLDFLNKSDTKDIQRKQIDDLKMELDESRKKLEQAEEMRNARKVVFLWTPEIREKLWEAIKTAKERLLMLSGWISSEIVNDTMAMEIRNALRRGVKIWIGYGFDRDTRRGKEQRDSTYWKQAEATLLKIQKEFPNQLVFKDIGWNHEKRLICDNRFTFGGSFNLLSFSGKADGKHKLRHEGTDVIFDPEVCEERWNYYFKTFFSS
ncbi:MAG: phospholipase D-like domain-containing protein [Dehalococcoidales bacterium]|nr:phospholipase D-like domain-containing protein [Dehalococcoidales bacterium]